MSMTCGEATMRLLANYGVTTVFGIPGVHTLDICRGLTGGGNSGALRHVQTRNEQGAGFMAEGWARATGEVGVAVVISGPGVTNAATALGQCYADSLPMLLISAEPDSHTIGKGWGVLHEITEQKKVTEPLTALSATARRAADVPELLAQAFSIFASQRPRPVHISLPMDVQAEMVEGDWQPVRLPDRPEPAAGKLPTAAAMLKDAQRPVIMVGGGATEASGGLAKAVERCGAVVISSTAGKGILPDDHPLHLSGSTVRPEVRDYLATADVILAVGTELAETDSFVERLELNGDLIRLDIDPHKINDFYPATLGIIGDAGPSMDDLAAYLSDHDCRAVRAAGTAAVASIREQIRANLTVSERKHLKFLNILREVAPERTVFSGDACQLVYTGAFAFDVQKPRQWFYPAGFCALGNGLPNAVGAKMARPETPVVVLAGDGGFMFTMPELMVAAELGLSLPIIIWENGGLKQIQDDMDLRSIQRVGVDGMNPDFVALAQACQCHAHRPESEKAFRNAFGAALSADRPTVIVVQEEAEWLR
ncbi:5-guanidino-2-oxopentanoate decarboxylase [Aliisedimentitalea scapharcae]|uniref:5-guanidino-2-oxopentanoate decarboxylase n=1 Tax=Aliisedimentitalea scapharcae TaxID=1524259 RepID=A0ABZ2XZB6_9RHOB